MYKWKKCGLIIKPNPKVWWMQTHAMVPTLEKIDDKTLKIYFSSRDDKNRSHIGHAIIDLDNPEKILEISKEPVLVPGALGCFDDNGVTPCSIVKNGNETNLYYIGWNPGSTTRMHIYGGLAISQDNGKTFQRYSRAPILERNIVNPYINTAPYAMKISENEWWMYYVSATEWVHKDLPRYNIQFAKSIDGKNWIREGKVCIDFKDNEDALARPYVIKENGIYQMWYSYKGNNYRIGYAESNDGLNWTRMDEKAGLDTTNSVWDSDMIEYAVVTTYNDRKLLFYNGNNYGLDGIGLAIQE